MEQFTVQGEINREGVLKIEVPCDLPPGPVEVTLTVRSPSASSAEAGPDWEQLYGLGKEVWQGMDPADYLRELREDREFVP